MIPTSTRQPRGFDIVLVQDTLLFSLKNFSALEMDSLSKTSVSLLLLCVVLLLVSLQQLGTWWRLRHIPGPFLGSLTNIQRVWWVRTKRAHLIHQEIHEKYGEVVRTGPNMVMFSNPEAIPSVYTTKPGFIKVPTYPLPV